MIQKKMKKMRGTMMIERKRLIKPGPAMCAMASTSFIPGTANIGVRFAACVQIIEPKTVGIKTGKETGLKTEEKGKDQRAEKESEGKEDNQLQDSRVDNRSPRARSNDETSRRQRRRSNS